MVSINGVGFTTAAPVGHLDNGGTKHDPLWLNVPHFPQDVVNVLPEVVVEAPSDVPSGPS